MDKLFRFSKMKQLIVLFSLIVLSFQIVQSQTTNSNDEIIEVRAVFDMDVNEHLFKLSSDSIASGWTHFKFVNASPSVHFMLIEKMPGKQTKKDIQKEILPIFQEAMNLINNGNAEQGFAYLGTLPEWYSEVYFDGGSGLLMPGRQTEFMTYLKPGNYIIECYIKTEDGTFHSLLGMVETLVVKEEQNGLSEPMNASLALYPTADGFNIKGDLVAGDHLVAVHFTEDKFGFLGNDVHVIKLSDETNLEKVAAWMDWSNPNGFISDHMGGSPLPAEFLGGSQEAPKGSTTYFKVNFSPGTYAFISEQPESNSVYEIFTIKEQPKGN